MSSRGEYHEDKLQCLECGKWYYSVGDHVRMAHTMTAREYKIKHCLPVKKSLSCAKLKAKRRAKAIKDELCKNGKNIQENVKGMAAEKYGYHSSPFKKKTLQESVKKAKSKLGRPWVDDDFIEFKSRMKTRAGRHVGNDPDMPCYNTYKRWEKNNVNI